MVNLYRPTFVQTISESIKEDFRKVLLVVGTLSQIWNWFLKYLAVGCAILFLYNYLSSLQLQVIEKQE